MSGYWFFIIFKIIWPLTYELWPLGSRVPKICLVYFYQSIYARTFMPAPSFSQILIFDHFSARVAPPDPCHGTGIRPEPTNTTKTRAPFLTSTAGPAPHEGPWFPAIWPPGGRGCQLDDTEGGQCGTVCSSRILISWRGPQGSIVTDTPPSATRVLRPTDR